MGRALSDQLVRALKTVDRPGSFCATGGGPAPLPGLEIAGLGPVGLPLTAAQGPELKKHGRQAPYGKGEETIVDTRVRRVWQLEPDRFSLTNPDWQPFLSATVQAVQRELGLEQQKLESHLYNLLLYEPGSFFLPHRDGEKLDRMVATLVVVLPSAFQGGELVVRHEGQEQVIDFGTPQRNPFHTYFAAFYADCEHEVRPLREGYRLCLVYNLTLAKAKKALTAPRTADRVDAVANILRSWSANDPRKLAVPLEHRYTRDGLVWDALKGADRARAKILNEAASQAECLAYLALLTLHESGAAEESYTPRRGRRYYYEEDEDDPDNYEMGEEFESSLTAEQWSDAAGTRPTFGEMTVQREEIVPPDALTKVKPDVDVSGYTGNEGLTLNRWYRHAVIVLWPAAHQFDVLCDCGLPSAVMALGEWVGRWQKARRTDAPQLKARCVEFAGKIIDRWGTDTRYREPGLGGLLMAIVVRIDDTQLIGAFLGRVVARDPLVEPDESLAEVFDKHGWGTFQEPLTTVIAGTTAETLARNVCLLDQLCTAKARAKGERLAVCAPLARKTVSVLEAIDRGEDALIDWRWRRVDRAEVLTGLARALIATEQVELLSQLVARALAVPKTYPLLAHIAALTALGPWLKKHLKKPAAALPQWLGACREQLEALTAHEPVAPADFRREVHLRCDCADCKEFKTFLKDPVEKVHRFRIRQDRRRHLEGNAHGSDVNFVTDRTGSPQTLVCTKNTASFDARLKKYREDLEHLATLRSIHASLPE